MSGDGGRRTMHDIQNTPQNLDNNQWYCHRCKKGPFSGAGDELRNHAVSAHEDLAKASPEGPTWKQFVAQSWCGRGAPPRLTFKNEALVYNPDNDDQGALDYETSSIECGGQSPEYVREGIGRLSLDQKQRSNPLKRDHQHSIPDSDEALRRRKLNKNDQGPLATGAQSFSHEEYPDTDRSIPSLQTPKTGTSQALASNPRNSNMSPKAGLEKSGRKQSKPHQHQKPGTSNIDDADDYPDQEPTLLLQPVTKSISQEQLRVELRSIYSGLVMVENKCKDVDKEQTKLAIEGNPSCRPVLSAKQWQALIALHKTLLHEFHDFFLASQHPAATPNLTKLAARNSMPARLWQFGIHNFLEVLRYRLPESLDYMLAFIYTAYSMMTLLYETVPAFTDTWVECLGDLGRYRMAVEDDDRRDRETWSGVSRYWYKMAADKNPSVGRLAHHLAILAPPFAFEQLSLYLRALISLSPFESAKTSILTVLNPVLEGKQDKTPQSSHVEVILIKLVGIMLKEEGLQDFATILQQWKVELIRFIYRSGSDLKSQGVLIMICTIAGLYEYGRSKPGNIPCSQLRRAQESRRASGLHAKNGAGSSSVIGADQSSSPPDSPSSPFPSKLEALSDEDYRISSRTIRLASSVTFVSFSIFLQFPDDVNVYPAIHEYFVILLELVQFKEILELVESYVPWTLIARFLTESVAQHPMISNKVGNAFPHSPEIDTPLPEDFVVQSLPHSRDYVAQAYLKKARVDREDQGIETPSMQVLRIQRIYYAGRRIASESDCLEYQPEPCSFRASERAAAFRQNEVLKVPSKQDMIYGFDNDMADAYEPEDVRVRTPESPPHLPATLSPQPSATVPSTQMPAAISIAAPRISPSLLAGKVPGSEARQPMSFQARTTPAKPVHPYNHEVQIFDHEPPDESVTK